MSDDQPVIAEKKPAKVELKAGEKYFWCACGKSSKQPFCDGSHEGTDFLPMSYTAESTRTLYFCGCKRTAGAPLCDGAHNALE